MTRRTNFKKKTHLESSKWEDMVSMKQQRLAQNAAIHDAQAHGHGTSDSALTASQTTQSTNTPEPKSTSLSTYHSSANNTLEVGPTAAVNTTGGGDIGEVGGGSKKRHRFKKNTSDGGVAGVDEDTFEGTRNTSNDPAEKRRRCMSQDKRANEQEKRKARRKAMKTICFACRKRGHAVSDCPMETSRSSASMCSSSSSSSASLMDANGNLLVPTPSSGICYKCGSTEHSVQLCKTQVTKENPYPFATCYVCKQQGHLSSQCEKNVRGLYPHGGECKYCGSVRHLAKDCETVKKGADADTVIELGTIDLSQGADDDDLSIAMHKKAKEASFVYEMKRSGTSNHNNASIGAVESSTSKIATATMKTKKKVVMMK